jgi:hypothetical protein
VAKFLKRLFTYPQWFIAYRPRKEFSLPFDTVGFKVISPPVGKFYADPFIIKVAGHNYIFFEEYCFIKQRGYISFVEVLTDGTVSEPTKVLEQEYHLSYPFLFKHNYTIYMIPETSGNHTIELYSAQAFPYDWKLEKVLLSGINASDTSVWFSHNKAWLFTNISGEGKQDYSDLSLFYAPSLMDEWQPHPQNPVVKDIRSARPAGQIFSFEGKIIRPSQNSKVRYGHSLVFNHIISIDENEYTETKIGQIEPNWYPGNQSCHTYNFNEDIEVIDGEVVQFDWLKPFRKVRSMFYNR